MKKTSSLFLALLAAGLITACGEKPATEMVEDAAEATTEMAGDAAEAAGDAVEAAADAAGDAAEAVAETVTSGGGYTQAEDEVIEGITMSQEELDAEAARIDAM